MRIIICVFVIMTTITPAPCWAGGKDKFEEAEALWQKGMEGGDEAAACYNDAIESGDLSDLQLVTAYYTLAIYHFMNQNLQKAIEKADEVFKIEPNHVGALSVRAHCYDILKNDERALSDFNKILEIDPDDAVVHNDLSYFYLNRGNFKKAISEMKIYLQKEPDSPEQLKQLERMQARNIEITQ